MSVANDQQILDLVNTTTGDIFRGPRSSVIWSWVMRSGHEELAASVNVPMDCHPTLTKVGILGQYRSARGFCNAVVNAIADAALRRFKFVRESLGLPEYKEYVVHKTIGTVQKRPYANSRSGKYRL